MGLFGRGQHGSTFGGNQLCSQAALTVLDIIEDEKLVENAGKMGKKLLDGFKERLKDNPHVKEVRGKGLMIGIEIDRDCPEIFTIGLEQRVLVNVTCGNVVRVLPPLNISENEASMIIDRVVKTIEIFTQ